MDEEEKSCRNNIVTWVFIAIWLLQRTGSSLSTLPRPPGPQTQALIREVLGFCHGDENPMDVKVESGWETDGVIGQEVSWSVGYGPRTHAYVLKPANAKGPLPGMVALHDHSDFKYFGREKIADGPEETQPAVKNLRQQMYGGRAYANALAREGFVVLVHDVFYGAAVVSPWRP